ncbi:hypothetical protein Tco_1550220, partial [Tanacetum coccineum]
ARIEADRLLAEKLQEEEREQFPIEERVKFIHDVAQRKFFAQQRSEAIRNRPPTKNQLRNQMMTYLKHVGNFKHSDLKAKKFEEIQACMKRLREEQTNPVINLHPTKLNMFGSQDEIPPPPPPPPSSPQTPTQQTPHTVSTIKLPILKKGEYDIWAMKMEHYLAHTDYPIWEVIQNGNGPVSITTDTQGQIKVLPPRTAKEIVARERERKARTTLLMALPEDHLAKFHKMTDAKEMWDAIKSRFGGNDESKKMQKYILKQQFEGFSVSNSEWLHKGYDRFQNLLSQLEIHEAGVSTEDANQKFLRSLPSAWSQVSLIMRTKPGVDSLSFDDLYNNLRVFENDVKGSTASSSSSQNVAFVSKNTNSTNDVSTAYSVSNTSGHNSQYEQTSSYSLLANQSSFPQLDHEDLENSQYEQTSSYSLLANQSSFPQ